MIDQIKIRNLKNNKQTMAEKIFAQWLILKSIDTKFGEMKKLSIKVEEFKEFLDIYDKNWWVNLVLKKGQSGKEYIELDTWEKPKEVPKSDEVSVEDLPSNKPHL